MVFYGADDDDDDDDRQRVDEDHLTLLWASNRSVLWDKRSPFTSGSASLAEAKNDPGLYYVTTKIIALIITNIDIVSFFVTIVTIITIIVIISSGPSSLTDAKTDPVL